MDGSAALSPSRLEFLGYEEVERGGVDLSKADVIVSAGRGVGLKENIEVVASLARALGAELGSSRPLVDAGWMEPGQQVGSTGQTVAPKLYVACGISGAIQHLAGMRRSGFIVAINKDRDAPISEVADVLAVGDVMEIVPAVLERLSRGGSP
jgi:electron transfer flavoprotein alpha subunit